MASPHVQAIDAEFARRGEPEPPARPEGPLSLLDLPALTQHSQASSRSWQRVALFVADFVLTSRHNGYDYYSRKESPLHRAFVASPWPLRADAEQAAAAESQRRREAIARRVGAARLEQQRQAVVREATVYGR